MHIFLSSPLTINIVDTYSPKILTKANNTRRLCKEKAPESRHLEIRVEGEDDDVDNGGEESAHPGPVDGAAHVADGEGAEVGAVAALEMSTSRTVNNTAKSICYNMRYCCIRTNLKHSAE